MGGTSSERDVSLASGLRIAEALRTRGHRVQAIDTARGPVTEADEQRMLAAGVVKQRPPSPSELARMSAESVADTAARLPTRGDCDVAFLALHGGRGEDGTIQALLDLAGVPYTGSGHLPSALAMDKDLSKHLFRAHGVGTADWLMATDHESPPEASLVERALGWPVIV
jgi:D-alanine-D-alanine ligase